MTKGLELRKDIDDQFLRSAFVLNGSGIVVLLAFVQALWPESPQLIRGVLYGMAPMLCGLFLAAVAPALRRRVSKLYEAAHPRLRTWERASWGVQWSSLLFFAVGAVTVVVAMLRALPAG